MTNKNKLGIIAIIVIIGFLIAACASLTIVSVDWDSLTGPARVRQYFNVSTTDVTVYANYKDGSRKEVTFFSTSHNRESTGRQTVTVNVLGQGTGTFQTEVMELTGIRVDRPPTKNTYNIGEKADLAGIRVIGSWRDMPDAEIPTYEITVASFNSSMAGTNRLVTINYKGKTATFPVTVTAAAAPAATTSAAPTTTQPSQPATTTPSTSQTYRIGDTGPGGGIIFYYNANGFTVTGAGSFTAYYLEAAPSNMEGLAWASSGYFSTDITGLGTAIGTGRANTAAILAVDANAPAAKACKDYTGGGKNDWFLPSYDELIEMYKARTRLGMPSARFWSSTQGDPTNGRLLDFSDGFIGHFGKAQIRFLVRAVRAF